jgi:hypothetical protein
MPVEFKVDGKIVVSLTDMDLKILGGKVRCGETWLSTLISEMLTNKVNASFKHIVEQWEEEEALVHDSVPTDRDARASQIMALPNYRSANAIQLKSDIEQTNSNKESCIQKLNSTTDEETRNNLQEQIDRLDAEITQYEAELAADIAKYST